MNIDITARKDKAIDFFNQGYNCAQAVFLAYSDVYGIDDEQAKTINYAAVQSMSNRLL